MDICPYHQPRTHGELGDREVRDKSLLTSFNIDGERFLNTSSEPREWLLRASATPSNGEGAPETLQGILAPHFDLPPNPSIDHLVPVILLEYDD